MVKLEFDGPAIVVPYEMTIGTRQGTIVSHRTRRSRCAGVSNGGKGWGERGPGIDLDSTFAPPAGHPARRPGMGKMSWQTRRQGAGGGGEHPGIDDGRPSCGAARKLRGRDLVSLDGTGR